MERPRPVIAVRELVTSVPDNATSLNDGNRPAEPRAGSVIDHVRHGVPWAARIGASAQGGIQRGGEVVQTVGFEALSVEVERRGALHAQREAVSNVAANAGEG